MTNSSLPASWLLSSLLIQFTYRRKQSLWSCVAVLGLGLSAACGRSSSPSAPPRGVELYVDAAVRASGNGSAQAPFRTIQEAANVSQPGTTVVIRAGTYRETVTPARSGTADAPIRFFAAPGAEVIVKGTEPLERFTRECPSCDRWVLQWQGQASADLEPGAYQVFRDCDDPWASTCQMLTEARWPNSGPEAPMHPALGMATGGEYPAEEDRDWALLDPHIPAGQDWAGTRVWYLNDYRAHAVTCEVTHVEQGRVSFRPRQRSELYLPRPEALYFVFGTLALLDTPDEFFFDGTTNRLYIAANPAGHRYEAKTRDLAFNLTDRSYIHLQGIRVFGATIAILGSATGNLLDRIQARYVSHQYNIHEAYDYPAEHSGIYLGGQGNEIRNSEIGFSSGNGVMVRGTEQRVINNDIHDVNYAASQAAAVFMVPGSDRALVSHNTLRNTGGAALGFYGTSHIIEYNDVRDISFMLEDTGSGMYTGLLDAGAAELRYNHIHGIRDSRYPTAYNGKSAIYLDGWTHNFLIHHNVFYDSRTYLGINNGGHHFVLYYNNVFYNSLVGLFLCGGRMWRVEIINNIFLQTHENDIEGQPGSVGCSPDPVPPDLVLAANNFIAHAPPGQCDSRYGCDPGFTDPQRGDFTLRPTSPLRGQGEQIPGITDASAGAVDLGAYPAGRWMPGCRGLPYEGCIADAGLPSPWPQFAPSFTPRRNLLIDGGFEGALNGWESQGAQPTVDFAAYRGDCGDTECRVHSHFLAAELGPNSARIAQQVTRLRAGREYLLSLWLRGDVGEQIEIKASGAAVERTQALTLAQGSNGWSANHHVIPFPVPADGTIRVQISKEGSGRVYLDDVSVTEVRVPP